MSRSKVSVLYKPIEVAFYNACDGVQVPIMDIDLVFAEGRRLIMDGADKAGLEAGLRAYCKRKGYEGAEAF